MESNPYQPPTTEAQVVGVKSGCREDLRAVAKYQKGILVCILIYLLLGLSRIAVPESLQMFLGFGILLLGLVGTIFVFLLALKVYSPVVGVVFGVCALLPCVGLLVLLVVNGKATSILRENGHKVGLLGANLSEF